MGPCAAGSRVEGTSDIRYDAFSRDRRLPGAALAAKTVSVQALLPNPTGGSMDTVSIDSRSLYSRLGFALAPSILDVRRAAAFDGDDRLIAGAVRPEGDLAS